MNEEIENLKDKKNFGYNAAISKAIEHLNQGCTVNYVTDGLKEWYGITTDPGELKNLLLQSKGLLPEEERKTNY